MQLTRLDRWLRARFVNETHVYTLRPPMVLPRSVRHEELPQSAASRFRHRYIISNPKLADELIRRLKEDNQMFATRVVDRKAWFVPLIAPKDKSLTWSVAWKLVGTAGMVSLVALVKMLWDNPTVRANVLDAIKVLQN